MKRQKLHSLRRYFIILIALSLCVFLAAFTAIFYTSLPRILSQAEKEHFNSEVKTVLGLLENSQENLAALTRDTAFWEETYQFVQGANPDFIEKNWYGTSLLGSFNLHFAIFKNKQSHDAYLDTAKPTEKAFVEGLSASLDPAAADLLAAYENNNTDEVGMSGIYLYNSIPCIISLMPIVSNQEDTEPGGVLVFGNVLSKDYFESITPDFNMEFEIYPEASPAAGDNPAEQVGQSSLSTTIPITDILGNKLLIKLSSRHNIYGNAMDAVNRTCALIVLAMLLFSALLYVIVNRFILRPIEMFSRDIREISSSEGNVDISKYSNSIEFSRLSGAINSMLKKIGSSKISVETMRRILNAIDAAIYVSDTHSDKVLFANDKGMNEFTTSGAVLGKKCWEVFYPNCFERCSDCVKLNLRDTGDSIIWEALIQGKRYRVSNSFIEWTDGSKATLHHLVDITAIREAETDLQKRLEQQELMAALSQSFVSDENTSDLIMRALQMVGEFMDASKIVLAKRNGDWLEGTYVWDNPNHSERLISIEKVPFVPGAIEYDAYLTEKRHYLVAEDTSADAKLLMAREKGLHALIEVPIFIDDEFWGLLGVSEVRGPRKWSASDIQLVRLIGTVISGVIVRDSAEQKLTHMSSIVDNSPQFISFINQGGIFEYLNQGALCHLGYQPEEL
ncbi:MAG: GAF domain-containing protein, partial [Desulfovibrionaceae bacterium]|nr:GAF domain-containing protein [Desulfovibrionaceae bacterium]